jgi:flagellar biosynthesis GTPase FlhF
MDKLDKKQKETVSKMSTARLTAKLALAGVSEEDIETLNREQLLDRWAELLLAGKTVPTESKSNFNIELERERLQFEKDKFAAEAEERRLTKEAEAEERRLSRELELWKVEEKKLAREAAAAAAWERTRLDEEKIERHEAREAEAERAKQQLIQLQLANRLQQEAMEKEKGKNDSVIAVLKQYGEAIRHSITKMADNPIEIIVFFDSAERLF